MIADFQRLPMLRVTGVYRIQPQNDGGALGQERSAAKLVR